jgi:prepilin-type N-terminal cleavage/methylation domain-containing protein
MEMERAMDTVTRAPRGEGVSDERGFSLIEVLVATVVLTVGLLPLVGVFATSVQQIGSSTPMMLAREKAREAVESVHAARDTGEASWATIRNNTTVGGVFLTGPQPVRAPGNDGLVNTADDAAAVLQLPTNQYTREIVINTLNFDGTATVNPNLREVQIIIRYRVGQMWRVYTLTTYISSYS